MAKTMMTPLPAFIKERPKTVEELIKIEEARYLAAVEALQHQADYLDWLTGAVDHPPLDVPRIPRDSRPRKETVDGTEARRRR